MHVIVDGVLRRFLRGLEQGPHIHVKTDIGKGRGNDLGPAVMAVLTHLDHQHARATAFGLGKRFDIFLNGGKAFVAFIGSAVDTCERFDLGPVPPEYLFHRHAYFSYRGPRAGRFDRCRQ